MLRLGLWRAARQQIAVQSTRFTLRSRQASSDSNAKPKSTISRILRYLSPAPPLLARYPTVYFVYRFARNSVAFLLSAHIFWVYFYSCEATYGISMLPTFNSFGDWVIISKYYRRGRGVCVGDVVSYRIPVESERVFGIKRVIGMPGDFVLRDSPGTSGLMIQIPQGHCWVAGENLKHARDSRYFGPLPLALINGKVVAKLAGRFPLWPERVQHGLQPALDDSDVD